MEIKKQRFLLVLFILLNCVTWLGFIIPNAVEVYESITVRLNSTPSNLPSQVIPAQSGIKPETDFSVLRDPFEKKGEPVSGQGKKPAKKEIVSKEMSPVKDKKIQLTGKEEKTFESRFRLKSIVKVNDKYEATLEERTSYNDEEEGVYSYRFNDENEGSGQKSYFVNAGDTVLGETVDRIKQDLVIMRKGKEFFKLTFSGGFPVKSPE